jgi:hypothetical protein
MYAEALAQAFLFLCVCVAVISVAEKKKVLVQKAHSVIRKVSQGIGYSRQ